MYTVKQITLALVLRQCLKHSYGCFFSLLYINHSMVFWLQCITNCCSKEGFKFILFPVFKTVPTNLSSIVQLIVLGNFCWREEGRSCTFPSSCPFTYSSWRRYKIWNHILCCVIVKLNFEEDNLFFLGFILLSWILLHILKFVSGCIFHILSVFHHISDGNFHGIVVKLKKHC